MAVGKLEIITRVKYERYNIVAGVEFSTVQVEGSVEFSTVQVEGSVRLPDVWIVEAFGADGIDKVLRDRSIFSLSKYVNRKLHGRWYAGNVYAGIHEMSQVLRLRGWQTDYPRSDPADWPSSSDAQWLSDGIKTSWPAGDCKDWPDELWQELANILIDARIRDAGQPRTKQTRE